MNSTVKVPEMELPELLEAASALFGPQHISGTYDFYLGKFSHGWQFNVTNSWQAWMTKGLTYTFGTYAIPEQAVRAFLEYVQENKINVRSLMDLSVDVAAKKRRSRK